MNCLRCKTKMLVLENRSVKFDICYLGCGGIWFDWMELKKIDESHEADPEFIKKLSQCATKKVNLSEKLKCPKCPNQPMIRRFSSIKRKAEIDECPKCGGFWLDAGELLSIHSEYKTEEEKQEATQKHIADLFATSPVVAKEHAEIKQELDKIDKFKNAVRFICPSYYISGKQKWGAF